jgi:aspartokinase-like uncharacterized kinase
VNRPLTVVKVGGSLYDLPDLRSRLQPWLSQAKSTDIILVPGGGATVNVIRDFDRAHHLGEERSHWLALAAMRLNAEFLSRLLRSVDVMPHWNQIEMARSEGAQSFVLDAAAFGLWDRMTNPHAALPHRWSVTSDSIAARVAVASEADHLVLLKSVTIPPGMDWEEAGERGFVDEWFARTVRTALPRLQVSAVNLREWRP